MPTDWLTDYGRRLIMNSQLDCVTLYCCCAFFRLSFMVHPIKFHSANFLMLHKGRDAREEFMRVFFYFHAIYWSCFVYILHIETFVQFKVVGCCNSLDVPLDKLKVVSCGHTPIVSGRSSVCDIEIINAIVSALNNFGTPFIWSILKEIHSSCLVNNPQIQSDITNLLTRFPSSCVDSSPIDKARNSRKSSRIQKRFSFFGERAFFPEFLVSHNTEHTRATTFFSSRQSSMQNFTWLSRIFLTILDAMRCDE